ncbi:MAG: amidohydrolase family protein [Proteobacteria bacterium]|nr:amidohydrolase family protein [Pseudomonadota bacterium]
MRTGRGLSLFLAAALAAGLGAPDADAKELYFVDAHSQIDHFVEQDEIIPLLDKAGVRHVFLSTRGKLKPRDITALAAKYPDRITASVRSKGRHFINDTPKWYRFMKKQFSMPGFGAVSEVIMWHAQKGNKAPEVVVPPDDKRVRTVLTGAMAKGWPFIIHIEFAASRSPKSFMKKMEAMLEENPNHPFALIHMGQLDAPEARRLLEKHPNFHFLISHSNPVVIRLSNQPWTDLFDGGETLAPEWKALFIEYPDRFILNFDNVFEEHWGTYFLKQAALWRKALLDLPADVASKVAHENAERLWKLPTVR